MISWPSGSVLCYISYSNDSSDTCSNGKLGTILGTTSIRCREGRTDIIQMTGSESGGRAVPTLQFQKMEWGLRRLRRYQKFDKCSAGEGQCSITKEPEMSLFMVKA